MAALEHTRLQILVGYIDGKWTANVWPGPEHAMPGGNPSIECLADDLWRSKGGKAAVLDVLVKPAGLNETASIQVLNRDLPPPPSFGYADVKSWPWWKFWHRF